MLIGSYNLNSPSNEEGFETGFTMSGTEKKKWTLKVDVKKGTDAVYLCAASLHSEHMALNYKTKTLWMAICNHTCLNHK